MKGKDLFGNASAHDVLATVVHDSSASTWDDLIVDRDRRWRSLLKWLWRAVKVDKNCYADLADLKRYCFRSRLRVG